jgi:excinuclease ABC subunit B
MYADKITDSMQKTIDDNLRKREKQISYNIQHGITPKTIIKSIDDIMKQTSVADAKQGAETQYYVEPDEFLIAADPVTENMSKPQLEKLIAETEKQMMKAAREMEFMEAARLRDEVFELKKKLEEV